MNQKIPVIPLSACAIGMICLILDSRCAAASVVEAIDLCLKTVIPSLFPLFFLSGVLVSCLGGIRIPALSRLCGIPSGSEGIVILGFIGGFPMGAQCITQAVEEKAISKKTGERMLGFCNNCGPAFLFGILGNVLDRSQHTAALFLIQITSALAVARLWAEETVDAASLPAMRLSLPQAVTRAVRSMVTVCAWIILANVMLSFLERWLFPFLPVTVQVLLTGCLELTSGCLALPQISDAGIKLLLSSGFICFGGLCVLLQIQGIAAGQGLCARVCVRQKLCQSILAALAALGYWQIGWIGVLIPLFLAFPGKKAVEKYRSMLYNGPSKGGIDHALSKKNAPVL